MAVRTFYLSSTLTDGWHSLTETVPGSNAALSPATGWIVSTGATLRSQVQPATERAATTFVGTTVPGPTLDTTLKDALRTPLVSGVFAAGNWTVGLPVNFVTSAAANGRAVFRLWRSANADGSSATEITSSQAVGSTVTVSALVRSTATIALGAVTLANEYLFLQVAWERTSAAAMSTSDVNLWSGASGASVLATTDFVPSIPVGGIPSGSRVFKPRLAGLPTLRQIVFGHAPTASSTNPYNGIMGGTGAWSAIETNHQVPWPCSGIFRNLVLEIGAGTSFTLNYALRINGVSTPLNVTLAPAETLTAVSTADVEVNAGDLVSLYYTFSGGTPGNVAARWALEFESGTPQESAYGQAIGASANDAAPRQTGAFAFHPTAAAGTAHLPQQVVAVAGTITRLSVRATANPGASAGMTWYFNLNGVRQDGTGGTPNTACAVINTTLASSSFSLPITPGDLVMVEGVSTGTFASVNWAVGHNFLAADPRHSVLGGSTGNLTAGAQATPPIQKNIGPNSNHSSFAQRSATHTTIPVTFKGMRVYHQTAPGVGHFRTVQLWAGLIRGTQGATTGLTTTVTDTEQTQSDLTHEYTTATAAPPDQLNMRYEEDGTAAQSFVAWGFAQINPTTPPLPAGDLILGATIASSASLFAPTAAIGGAGGGAALVGAATVAIAGTASLTTSVRLVGASTVAITASSSLATGIALTGAATTTVTSTSVLTTAIRLTGAASLTITTTADLSVGSGLAGAASLTITGASLLTTAVRLSGAATVAVSAAGVLTTAAPVFADIRQQILNGLDSAQAEAAGWDALKATIPVSAVVRTSDTVVTITLPALASYAITADETITATVPGVAVTSGNPVVATPTITVLATVGVPAALAGAASLTITTASALTTAIALTGAASTTVTSTSTLSTAIRLSGAATVTVTSTSALTSAISLSGAATVTVTTASALSTAVRLAGAATATVTSTSSLTTAIRLAGLASVSITTTSDLSAGSGLAGAATLTITGASTLTTALPLVAGATLTVTAASTLSTAIRFTSTASLTITTASALSSSIRLAGAGTVTVTTAGTLTTGLTLAGTASVVIAGASSLTTQVMLAGAATVTITTSAAMSAVGAALQGAATLTVTTASGLTTAIRLSGAASTTVTSTSALTTQVRLAGAGAVVITTSAVLSSGAATLQGAASVTITTSSSLTTGLTLRGTAQIVVLASSGLATAIRLSGTAQLVILATSSLAPAIVPTADVIIRIAADDLVYLLASDDLVYGVAADDVRCRLVADDVVCALAADDISLAA